MNTPKEARETPQVPDTAKRKRPVPTEATTPPPSPHSVKTSSGLDMEVKRG